MSDLTQPVIAIIDVADCLRLLMGGQVGTLVEPGNPPHVRPVTYVFDGDDIVVRTDEPITEDAEVVFELDHFDTIERQGWSVIANGRVHHVDVEDLDPLVLDALTPWAPGPKQCFTRIPVESISGRWVRAARERPELDRRGYL